VKKVLLGAAAALIALRAALTLLPYPELAAYRERSYGLVIEDRKGVTLRVFPSLEGVRREWVPLEEIPAGAARIFLKAEDRRYYVHPGIDIIAVIRSAARNIKARRIVSGASTITMQLARLVRARSGGYGAKLAEAWDALRLEARLSKREILELWLNGIPFGSNIEGLAAVTRARFGLPIAALDDRRALLLAVIPRRPGRYDPALNPEAAVRAAGLLARRCGLDMDPADLRAAAEEAASSAGSRERSPFFAPHFTGRLAAEIRERGSSETGASGSAPDAGPGGRPRRVMSTLDLGLQNYGRDLLVQEISRLRENRVSNGAILAIENSSGAVRIYAGSASWFDDPNSGKIDGVRVPNQPGSCLKPFLYALALDRGFSPAAVLPDTPTVFGGSEAYAPENFNRRFNGPVRFRVSLASSLNVPAVYLLERLGVRTFEDYLAALGFDSIRETQGTHGVGLALGNAEVTLEELVRGFAAFPRGGTVPVLRFVEEAGPGLSAEAPSPPEGRRVMSSYAAWMIADILSDRSSRFVGFGPAPAFSTPFPAMFKTGTANQYQHIWALGATKNFTVGVWMGNFSGATVVGRTGSSNPARIVRLLLSALEQGRDGEAAASGAGPGTPLGEEPPETAAVVELCALSGLAAGPGCGGRIREWLREEDLPPECGWHRKGELSYPPEYRSWLVERFRRGSVSPEGEAAIRLPAPGAVFYRDPALPPEAQALRIETAGFAGEARLFVDGLLQGLLNDAGVYVLPLSRGKHTLLVEDERGVQAESHFEVR
jgi:penicillin-binding protein 1C